MRPIPSGILHYATLMLISTATARSQHIQHPAPVDPKQFAVMAWGQSPSDTDQLRGMREAGLNVSGFCRPADIEKVRAAGLTCFISDRQISGLDLLHLPPDDEIRRNVAALKDQIGGNPAALGFYLRDEPNAAEMPGLG